MILAHAKCLAAEKVTRGGQEFPKNGPFTAEQLKAEDWEPVEKVADVSKLPEGKKD